MRPEVIEVENLSSTFGDKLILNNISFKAFKNEITIVLGKSGSGKTVTLKHLLGLYPIQQGRISVMGQELGTSSEDEMSRLRLQLGVLFQNGALINSLSVSENIAIPLEQHTDLPAFLIERLIRMKLALVGLEEAGKLLPSQLSGGMRKRAALARALALDPPLLFCDEPSAGLDPITLEALDELILQLKNELGMTIIMVTHEVSSIFRLADRIVFIEEGRVTYQGSLREALAEKHPAIVEFFTKAKGKN